MSDPKELSFVEKLQAPVSTLWAKHKGFLIGFGLLILIVRFRSVIIDFLVADVHKTVDKAEKKDESLRQEQNAANDQANQLRKEASEIGQNKPTVDEDWHKK